MSKFLFFCPLGRIEVCVSEGVGVGGLSLVPSGKLVGGWVTVGGGEGMMRSISRSGVLKASSISSCARVTDR